MRSVDRGTCKELTTVQCLGLIKGSHCSHCDKEAPFRLLYLKLVGSGALTPGYDCDNDASSPPA